MITTIYLIRHSEKMPLPHGKYPVDGDRIQPLSVTGEQKAAKLLNLEELRGADLACCSPFARTISTLKYLVEADGLPLKLDDNLRELDFGEMPGLPPKGQSPIIPKSISDCPPPELMPSGFQDIRAKQWIDRDLSAIGGESLNQCCQRMSKTVLSLVSEHPGKKILVGSHGAAICAYVSSLISGIDDNYTRKLPQPAVFRLRFDEQTVVEVQRVL